MAATRPRGPSYLLKVTTLCLTFSLLFLHCGGASSLLRHRSASTSSSASASTILASLKAKQQTGPIFYPLGELTYGHAGPARRREFSKTWTPGWRCLACEDVVQTWRDTYRCAGDMDAGKALTERDSWDYGGCHTPGICSSLSLFGHAQVKNCEEFEKAIFEGSNAKMYYGLAASVLAMAGSSDTPPSPEIDGYNKQNMRYAEKKFEVCSQFCSPDARDCFTVLVSPECRLDARCDKLRENPDICEPSCISCFWAIEGVPQFEEICKLGIFESDTTFPGTGQFRQAFPTEERRTLKLGNEDVPKALSEDEKVKLPWKPTVGLGSLPLETDGPAFALPHRPVSGQKPKDTPIAYEQIKVVCYEMWKEFEKDMTARYMIQYLDNLGQFGEWNAHTVCQCLKRCPYDEMQALDLLPACSAMQNVQGSADVIKESLFPDNLMNYKPDRLYGDPPGGKLAKESHMVQTFNRDTKTEPNDYKGFHVGHDALATSTKYREAPEGTDPFKPSDELLDQLDRT